MQDKGTHDPLTAEREAEIRKELETDPVATASWYDSPVDEQIGNLQTTHFALVAAGNADSDAWEVWLLDKVESLCFDGAFISHAEAGEYADRRARETQTAGEEWLLSQKMEKWEQRKAIPFTGTGPFTFRDNTDYRSGWELFDEMAVFAFFVQNTQLLRPNEWGNAYECDLVGSKGEPCWVVQSPLGEMLIEPVGSD